jgi:hypothetical protein
MSSRSQKPSDRAAQIALCLLLFGAALACLFAGTAKASYYKTVMCAAHNGLGSPDPSIATNTVSPQNPGGIFVYQNQCSGDPAGFPAGGDSLIRLFENQGSGNAGYQAYASVSWTAPPMVSIAGGGGYTRQPNDFADGWRARFWGEGYDGSTNNFLMQGAGVENNSLGGVGWARTYTFASHLWPFGSYGNYRRFVYEMTCFRPAGCDRSGFNATDANTFVLTMNDVDPSRVSLSNTGSGILSGAWVRGPQNVTWDLSEQGSGMRFERVRVDGGLRHENNWRGSCNIDDANGTTGDFAREFKPCPIGSWSRGYTLETASLSDGGHTVQVCSQDYGQAVGLSGSGGESCDQRSIRVDNHPPAAPAGLVISTSNPERYLDHFGARWTLPPDPGSPIAKVHYSVVNAANSAVVPEKVLKATDPTALEVEGPKTPGDYRLRVWLEDTVGLSGPPATVPIPHDTTPPASPQEVSIAPPSSSRSDQGFDVRWRNITDNGAPIDAVHYQVVNGAGEVLVATKDLGGDSPQALLDLDAPKKSGNYNLKIWLSDAEGNRGAPAEAPLAYDCTRSEAGGGQNLSVGIGDKSERTMTVHQGQGSIANGSVLSAAGGVGTAAVCLFSRVVSDNGLEFIGTAITSEDGSYKFPIAAGPSREIIARYRKGHRQLEATATVLTQVEPTLKLRKKVVRNKRKAIFYGDIPGPHADDVLIVLQVKSGKGWRAFRRYRTRDGGHFEVGYRFTQTSRESVYTMRAQVRGAVGYPYEPGNSREVKLRVRP